MKPFTKRKILIASFAIITALGVCLPSFMLHVISSSALNSIQTASSNQYDTAQSAFFQNASLQLSEYERIKLISGIWESTEIASENSPSITNEATAVELAKSTVKRLYDAKLYPYYFDTKYDNWYSWDAECYQCTEKSFQTYTAHYWKVTFYHYNSTETHDILLTENGTLLAISNNVATETNTGIQKMQTSRKNAIQQYCTSCFTSESMELFEYTTENELLLYKRMEFQPMNQTASYLFVLNQSNITSVEDFEKTKNNLSENAEIYHILQYEDDNYFLLCFLPITA